MKFINIQSEDKIEGIRKDSISNYSYIKDEKLLKLNILTLTNATVHFEMPNVRIGDFYNFQSDINKD